MMMDGDGDDHGDGDGDDDDDDDDEVSYGFCMTLDKLPEMIRLMI